MQNSLVVFTFFCLIQKFKIVWKNEIWSLDLFDFADFKGAIHFICIRAEIPFLGKFEQNVKYLIGIWSIQ